jgi:hypothetical protein
MSDQQTAVTTPKTFEEKLTDRIKENIGDLIPDEELKKILERGIDKIFFQARPPAPNSGYSTQPRCSLAEELAEKCIKEAVDRLVTQFIKDNTDKIIENLRPTFEQRLGDIVLNAFNMRAQSDMMIFGENLVNRIRSGHF